MVYNTAKADPAEHCFCSVNVSLLNLSVNPKGPLVPKDTIEVLQNI